MAEDARELTDALQHVILNYTQQITARIPRKPFTTDTDATVRLTPR